MSRRVEPLFRRRCAATSRVLAAAFAGLAALVGPARADYQIQQGDTIEISVAGLPELRQHCVVQTDGSIAFPLVGAMPVEGLTPSELRALVQKQLARKIYRQHANDGREVLTVIQPEEVSAAIVAYRPIYVTGDVGKPGEQAFRPEMTARQAVALAGGADALQVRAADPDRAAAGLRADREIALVDLAKAIARVARVNAELSGVDKLAPVEFGDVPLAATRLAEIQRLESDVLQARVADYQRERAFLVSAVEQADGRISVVEKLQTAEDQGARADTVELQRLNDLLNRGQETNPRVTEARRALLLSATRTLQVNVELLELKRQRAESARKVTQFDDERRIALLEQLRDARTSLAALQIKRTGIEQTLRMMRSTPADSLAKRPIQIIEVIRRDAKGSTRTQVDGETVLTPGDVVEVTLQAPDPADAPVR